MAAQTGVANTNELGSRRV